MGKLLLTMAGGKYDRVDPLLSGDIKPEGIDLNYIILRPMEIFWRMIRYREFDASEMSLAAYTILRSRGVEDFIAIPVFISKMFRHSSIYVRNDADIVNPQDLEGRKIGLPEFQATTSIWVRGILQSEYGLNLEKITWYLGGLDQAGRKERIAIKTNKYQIITSKDRSLSDLLLQGEIDAIITANMPKPFVDEDHTMRRLFPDYRKQEVKYYQKTGIIPLMHLVVVKKEIAQQYPWVPMSLYKAYNQALQVALKHIYDTDALPVSLFWLSDYIEEERIELGQGFEALWSYGVMNNLPILEAFMNYCKEQDLLESKVSLDELFFESTRDT